LSDGRGASVASRSRPEVGPFLTRTLVRRVYLQLPIPVSEMRSGLPRYIPTSAHDSWQVLMFGIWLTFGSITKSEPDSLSRAFTITVGTVPEILKRVHLKHQEEVLAELEEQRRLRQEEKKAEDARQERVRQRAQKVAHILANIIKWGLWIVLVAGAFYAISGGSPLSQTSILRSILSIVAGLIAAFAIINLMHNTPLDAVINRFEKYVAAKIEQWLRNLTR
jgi:hypothetical protein